MRDLNHHIPAYWMVAKITLFDWMCKKNDCFYPLAGNSLLRDFSLLDQSIPSTWLTAHQILKKLDLSLMKTDQSYIAEGDVSLLHIAHSCGQSLPQAVGKVNRTTLRSL